MVRNITSVGVSLNAGVSTGDIGLIMDFMHNRQSYEPELTEVKKNIYNKTDEQIEKSQVITPVKPKQSIQAIKEKYALNKKKKTALEIPTDSQIIDEQIIMEDNLTDDLDFDTEFNIKEQKVEEIENKNVSTLNEDEYIEEKDLIQNQIEGDDNEYVDEDEYIEEKDSLDNEENSIDDDDYIDDDDEYIDGEGIDEYEEDDANIEEDDANIEEDDDDIGEDEDYIDETEIDTTEDGEEYTEDDDIYDYENETDDNIEEDDDIEEDDIEEDEYIDDDEEVEATKKDTKPSWINFGEPLVKEDVKVEIKETHEAEPSWIKFGEPLVVKEETKQEVEHKENSTELFKLEEKNQNKKNRDKLYELELELERMKNKQLEEKVKMLEEKMELEKRISELTKQTQVAVQQPIANRVIHDKVEEANEIENLTHRRAMAIKELSKETKENSKQVPIEQTRKLSNEARYRLYSEMKPEVFYSKVKKFMIDKGVKKKPVPMSDLNEKFGTDNIKKLVTQHYLIKTSKGVTIGK